MGSKWKKMKMLLGLHSCSVASPHSGDLAACEFQAPFPAVQSISSASHEMLSAETVPTTAGCSPSRLSLTRRSNRLTRTTCSICLETMKPGLGLALFTAECSHTFHFSCIASNVRFGNLLCPVCRAKWREVPWIASADVPKSDVGRGSRARRIFTSSLRSTLQIEGGDGSPAAEDPVLRILDQNIANARGYWRNIPSEPVSYDDDEPLHPSGDIGSIGSDSTPEGGLIRPAEDTSGVTGKAQPGTGEEERTASPEMDGIEILDRMLEIESYSEVPMVAASESRENFTVLVHLKAPPASRLRSGELPDSFQLVEHSCRAPIDLVTVLDVSGSMAGTKLGLLKRAMDFVIRNLSSADRLAVVAFSTNARRIFPLRRMVEEGRQQALQAIEALVSTGGTNIAEGLRKGAKVLEDRRQRNPVSSIMLLSDGQDTYTLGNRRHVPYLLSRVGTDPGRLVPNSIRHILRHGHAQIPVHTFGFGADHDASAMHAISEVSGGTFSFIQAEGVVQDAFAQCIGGLLSVVIQDVQLMVSCGAPGVHINSIQAGSYESSILDNANHGMIKLGDLYAEEERDVLVEVKLPPLPQGQFGATMPILQVGCMYKNPVTQEINHTTAHQLCISRPATLQGEQLVVSLAVDRHRNRLRTAQAIAEARYLADQGDISAAQNCLRAAKAALQSSASAQAGDQLCGVLEAELTEIQVRMANRHLYERSGRAFLLSAQSSHSRQRATTRGESVESHSRDYQTPSMVDMILRSQTLSSTVFPGRRFMPSQSSRPNRGRNSNISVSPPSDTLSHGKIQDSQNSG